MTITEQLAAALRPFADSLVAQTNVDHPSQDWREETGDTVVSIATSHQRKGMPVLSPDHTLSVGAFRQARAILAAYEARPAASDDAAVHHPMQDYEIRQWIEACNYEPARDVLRGVLADRARALAVMAAPAADGWQDIATAPKDGTRVLLWMEPYDPIESREQEPSAAVIGSYVVWSPMMKQQGMKDGWSWYGAARTTPTHWRPLPPAPDTKGSGQ